MRQVNIHQAKTQLSRRVERASAGEEIVIAKAGRWPAWWPSAAPHRPANPAR